MGYYQDLLNKIEIVESQGFNPYTETYSARIGQLETQSMPTQENVVSSPSIDDPVSQISPQYSQAWIDYGQQQALATKAFQEAYPSVNVGDILKEYSAMEDFSNAELDRYSKQLTEKYGELTITPDEVKEYSPDYYKTLNVLKEEEKRDITKGDVETDDSEELFGWRNLLQRRYKKDESYYKYLDEIDAENTLEKFDKKSKSK